MPRLKLESVCHGQSCFTRLEPLSGRISSVTQIFHEERKAASALTMHDLRPGNSRVDVTPGDRIGDKEGGGGGRDGDERGMMEHDEDTSGLEKEGIIPGGVFAGVGKFSPTPKSDSSERVELPQLQELDMKYAEETMLRWVD